MTIEQRLLLTIETSVFSVTRWFGWDTGKSITIKCAGHSECSYWVL